MEDLVGLWESAPYDYGTMESSWLCLRADGTGWSAWANAAGGASISRFTWARPRDGELDLQYHWTASGSWTSDTQTTTPPSLIEIDEEGPDHSFIHTGYTIKVDTTPLTEQPITALHLGTAIECAHQFGLATRDPAADDPA